MRERIRKRLTYNFEIREMINGGNKRFKIFIRINNNQEKKAKETENRVKNLLNQKAKLSLLNP